VKPQFSIPAFSEFPYLVNILSGPSQSPKKQCIIFLYLLNLDLVNNPHLVKKTMDLSKIIPRFSAEMVQISQKHASCNCNATSCQTASRHAASGGL
jgi:hypothetical protein